MLNNLIRKYNRNRREIWIVVVIIAFIIGFRYALTSYMKNDKIGSSNNATTYFPNNNQNDYPILNNKIYEDFFNIVQKYLIYILININTNK